MPGWVMSLVGCLGRIALAVGAALIALWSARRAGRKEARVEARAETLETLADVQSRMLDAARDRAADRDELVGRLRDGRF